MPYFKFTKHLNRFFPDLKEGPVPGATVADVIQALDARHPGLAFGTTTGTLFLSDDRGDHWTCLTPYLAPVYSVRFIAA